jgi:glycine/sarcosine N-methyltransferase
MTFYKSISDYYREVFPLQAAQANFVLDSFPDAAKLSLLDVGCGTGDLALELSKSFNRVTGIDLDSAMLEFARESAPENTVFQNLNMLEIRRRFGEDSYSGVLCFGNTLVHLNELESMSTFIQHARAVLGKKGKLLIQLINYDRILDQDIKALPTIKTDNCTFERNYHYDPKNHMVKFETILTIKTRGASIRNQIPLYPLRKLELQSILEAAGFNSISYFGNFKRDPLKKNSVPLVVEASI